VHAAAANQPPTTLMSRQAVGRVGVMVAWRQGHATATPTLPTAWQLARRESWASLRHTTPHHTTHTCDLAVEHRPCGCPIHGVVLLQLLGHHQALRVEQASNLAARALRKIRRDLSAFGCIGVVWERQGDRLKVSGTGHTGFIVQHSRPEETSSPTPSNTPGRLRWPWL
jgi:hypothetical protein